MSRTERTILWITICLAIFLWNIMFTKPLPMSPCNTWVWDIYYKCPVQTAWEPNQIDFNSLNK